MHRAGEAVAVLAPDARAVGHVGLVQADATRGVERVVPRLLEVVGELLDARLVRHRRERVGRARVALGRVLAVRPVHLVQVLGLRVVGLQLVVGDGPGGREPVVMLQLAEVLRPQPVERRPVELGGAADEVVDLRLERRSVGVVPGVRRDVAIVDEHVLGKPVRRLPREPVPSFEHQNPLPRRRQMAGQRTAAGAAPHDDDVVVVAHRASLVLLHELGQHDPRGGLHQRQVRERLREVAQVTAGRRVELLRVQPER